MCFSEVESETWHSGDPLMACSGIESEPRHFTPGPKSFLYLLSCDLGKSGTGGRDWNVG